jgi:DNA polymerase-3 subunit epsilon
VDALNYPDVDNEMRERLLRVIRDEVGAMEPARARVGSATAEGLKTRWPLEDMLGADVVQAALRRIESTCAMKAASGGGRLAVAEGRQLFPAAGPELAGLSPARGARRARRRAAPRRCGPQRAHLDLSGPASP